MLHLAPPLYKFARRQYDALLDTASRVREFMRYDKITSPAQLHLYGRGRHRGAMPDGRFYGEDCFRRLCRVLHPGLFQFLLDFSGVRRLSGYVLHEYSFSESAEIFNKVVTRRYSRIADGYLVGNEDMVDGIRATIRDQYTADGVLQSFVSWHGKLELLEGELRGRRLFARFLDTSLESCPFSSSSRNYYFLPGFDLLFETYASYSLYVKPMWIDAATGDAFPRRDDRRKSNLAARRRSGRDEELEHYYDYCLQNVQSRRYLEALLTRAAGIPAKRHAGRLLYLIRVRLLPSGIESAAITDCFYALPDDASVLDCALAVLSLCRDLPRDARSRCEGVAHRLFHDTGVYT